MSRSYRSSPVRKGAGRPRVARYWKTLANRTLRAAVRSWLAGDIESRPPPTLRDVSQVWDWNDYVWDHWRTCHEESNPLQWMRREASDLRWAARVDGFDGRCHETRKPWKFIGK